MTGPGRVAILLVATLGCHHTQPAVALRSVAPSVAPVSIELPLTKPTVPVLDGKGLPQVPPAQAAWPEGWAFRKLTEPDCQAMAAANVSTANALDDENRVPPPQPECETSTDQLRRTLRYHTALELRNQAAGQALDRFFQLTDAEARTDTLRQVVPIIDGLSTRARAAKAADARFPLDPADLDRQRSVLQTQLDQAELGTRLLNLDLKRRLGLPYQPAEERLWPTGEFTIDHTPIDPETAANVALADRPELRGLRALYHGLTPETLPDVRQSLRACNPLLGQMTPPVEPRPLALVRQWVSHKPSNPDPAVLAEVEVRRKQLHQIIVDRERGVADEARAAALMLNAQQVRAMQARDRFEGWEVKLADALKKQQAKQPGAEFLEPQVRIEWLKAKAELQAEVAAWHQARVRLRMAQGWFAWEAIRE